MEELGRSTAEIHQNPAFVPGTHSVIDMLDMESFDIGFDQMQAFSRLTRERHGARGAAFCMFAIYDSDPGRWLSDMFIALAEMDPGMVTVEVVSGFHELLAVLDLPEDMITLFPKDRQDDAHLG